jgi:hypothetical protein
MNTDAALWTIRRRFGNAGGPDEITLTDEGLARAFSVGASVRRGGPSEALEALWSASGAAYVLLRKNGVWTHTEFGRRHTGVAWGHLRALGLVESFYNKHGDGVALTERGKIAAKCGLEERERLLERCRSAQSK